MSVNLENIPTDKLYYTISEAATLLNLTAPTLRYWEEEFPTLIKPDKTAKGDRRYQQKDLEKIRFINNLLHNKGFTINGARDYIKSHGVKKYEAPEIIAMLQKIKASLLTLKEKIPNE